MDKKEQTTETYNKSAKELANKFDNQGARITDIEDIFRVIKKNNPNTLEIGCGNGRDAKEILKYTNKYLGIDISRELIKLAKEKVPQGNFNVIDVENFEFPKNLDVVIAFASLLHNDEENVKIIFNKVFESLNDNGVFFVSLKYGDKYKEITKNDEFGIRTFYLYSSDKIKELSNKFKIIKEDIRDLRGQKWIDVLLQK